MGIDWRKIVIVGCGPGSPDYLTPMARQAVEKAEVLVGADRLLNLFPRSSAERISVGTNIGKVLHEIAMRVGKERITVLVSGDPGLCSLAQPVVIRFGRDACDVIPGVSSLQVAFARLGLEWHDVRIINAHGREPDVDPGSLRDVEKIAVLVGRNESLDWIRTLVECLGEDHRVFVCENLTLPEERVRQIEPTDLEFLHIPGRTILLLIKKDLVSWNSEPSTG